MNTRLGGNAVSRAAVRGCRRRLLFGGIGLAGEKRFIDVEVAGFDQPGIGGHEIAGREKNDIAGHDLRHRNIDRLSIAKRLGGKRDLLAQTAPRRFGPGAPASRRGSRTSARWRR